MTSPDPELDSRRTSPARSRLARAWAAYPAHPPLSHVTIGAYTTAALLGVVGAAGVSEPSLAKGWWLSLLVGLLASLPTAASGLVDFVSLARDHPARPTVIIHLSLALLTYPSFIAAILLGHTGYVHGSITAGPLVLTLVGFATLTATGFVGGRLVFRRGLRVRRSAIPDDDPTQQWSGRTQLDARSRWTR